MVTLLDVMPTGDDRADVVRRLTGVSGTVRMRHEWVVRLDYGAIRPWVRRRDIRGEEVITAVAGPDKLILRGPRLPRGRRPPPRRRVRRRGRRRAHLLDDLDPVLRAHAAERRPDRSRQTIADDEEWAARCHDDVPHADVVRRSLLTLRLMTHEQTGGIVAAPTTSLPEDFGGERNWDYRYCWLRDAALTIDSLIDAGYTDEARLWRHWLLRAVAGDPEDLQIMYAVDGAPPPARAHPRPPARLRRVAAGADRQRRRRAAPARRARRGDDRARSRPRPPGSRHDDDAWALQRALVEPLADDLAASPTTACGRSAARSALHPLPGDGLGGVRPRGPRRRGRRPGRAGRPVARGPRRGPRGGADARLRRRAQHLRPALRHRPRSTPRCWCCPLVGFIEGDDPRMLGTIEAIEQDLMRDGLLLRYRTETGVDGLAGDEHPFLACSFWLVSAYAAAGRLDDAARPLRPARRPDQRRRPARRRSTTRANERMVGNFPQAFSHLALVQAAFRLRGRRPASSARHAAG